MGPKKKGKKPAKGADGEVPGEDPLQFLHNYLRFSRQIGIAPNPKIVAQIQDEENYPLSQARAQNSTYLNSVQIVGCSTRKMICRLLCIAGMEAALCSVLVGFGLVSFRVTIKAP